MTENNKNIEENIENIPVRRNDIDALRVLATILLIYFHTAMFFVLYMGNFFQNEELSLELYIFVMFVYLWHMPLFFFLAGMSTFYSLNVRTDKQYLKERFKRLLIPFLLGILIVIPPIIYFERLASWSETRWRQIDFNGSYFEFYPHFFEMGTFHWYHLWFILYLFLFSLVALPLFLRLMRKQQNNSIVNYFGKGKKIFLFVLPLILINICLRWIFPDALALDIINDWPQMLGHLTFFIFGFLIIGDIRFENSIDRNRMLALVLAVITSPIVLFFYYTYHSSYYTDVNPIDYYIVYAIFWVLASLCSWCWLITIFGYGRKYLTKQNFLISHLSEIALPFYIIHQTIIVIIGFYVLQWEATILVKFLVISTLSLFITILLCELIKTNNLTRFIFGMRPKEKKKEDKSLLS